MEYFYEVLMNNFTFNAIFNAFPGYNIGSLPEVN